jgi:hypothetical protein
MGLEYTDIFHTLRSKLGIRDSVWHLVLNNHSDLHRYIPTYMDFLNISSLGVVYRYVVKIEHKFNRGISGSLGMQIRRNRSMVKVYPTHRTKDRERIANLNTTNARNRKGRVT